MRVISNDVLSDKAWAVPGLRRMVYASGVDAMMDECYLRPPGDGTGWVVNLHGHGAWGDQLFTRPDVRDLWWPEIDKRGLGILSPTLRDKAWMGPAAAADLHALLAVIRTLYGAQRFIFIGGSMGGTSCLIYAGLFPADVACVAAVCPATDLASYYPFLRSKNEGVWREIADAIVMSYGGEPATLPGLFQKHSAVASAGNLKMPIFVAAAEGDAIIPVDQPRALAKAMGSSSSFLYREQAGGHHDSPVTALPEGLAWVLARLG